MERIPLYRSFASSFTSSISTIMITRRKLVTIMIYFLAINDHMICFQSFNNNNHYLEMEQECGMGPRDRHLCCFLFAAYISSCGNSRTQNMIISQKNHIFVPLAWEVSSVWCTEVINFFCRIQQSWFYFIFVN